MSVTPYYKEDEMVEEGKKRIMILACALIRDKACIACQRCLMGMERKNGEFERYKDDPALIVGIIECGGCPGASVVVRMAQLKTWMAPFGEGIDVVHIGTCLMGNCPYKESIIEKVKAKAGVPVVEGTHHFLPADIFAKK